MSRPPRAPAPPTFPQRFPGQGLMRFRRDPLVYLRRAASECGDVVRLPLGRQPVFLVNHPDLIKDIFVTSQKSFKKGRGLEQIKRLLGEGLLTSEGDFHLRQRRLIQPAFHRQRITAYGAAMTDYAVQTGRRWRDGETLDVHAEMMRLTLAVVGKTLFGAEVEAEAQEIDGALGEIIGLFHLLQLPYSHLLERLPFPQVRRFRAARARLDATVYRLIGAHRAQGAEPDGSGGDLLSMLLEARDEDDGGAMSDGQVRDEVMTMFLAGHETTANALTWTWLLLSLNPACEARFHAELDEVLAGRTPTADDLPRLTYTRQIISESMRLYPPAWAIGRRALADHALGDYVIPQGAVILIAPAVTHRDPRFFPDPNRFDPDRWTPEAESARPKFAFVPFGGGARVCIGEQFAWMELVLLLATLGQRWRLRLASDQIVDTQPIVTLRPRYGMRMKIEARVLKSSPRAI